MNFSVLIPGGIRRAVSPDMLVRAFVSKDKPTAVSSLTIAEQFQDFFGAPCNQQAVEALYETFFPNTLNLDQSSCHQFTLFPTGKYSTKNINLLSQFLKAVNSLIDKDCDRVLLKSHNSPISVHSNESWIWLTFFDKCIYFSNENMSSDELNQLNANLNQFCNCNIYDKSTMLGTGYMLDY